MRTCPCRVHLYFGQGARSMVLMAGMGQIVRTCVRTVDYHTEGLVRMQHAKLLSLSVGGTLAPYQGQMPLVIAADLILQLGVFGESHFFSKFCALVALGKRHPLA